MTAHAQLDRMTAAFTSLCDIIDEFPKALRRKIMKEHFESKQTSLNFPRHNCFVRCHFYLLRVRKTEISLKHFQQFFRACKRVFDSSLRLHFLFFPPLSK